MLGINKLTPTSSFSVGISLNAYRKMMAYTHAASGEVSGLGIVSKTEDNKLHIDDIIILPQTASSAETELDDKALSTFLMDYVTKGGDPSAIKVWWHSHGNTPVFWSTTDEKTMGAFDTQKTMIFIVVNKKEDCLVRLVLKDELQMCFDNGSLAINYEDSLEADCRAEVKEKVTPMKAYYPNWNRKGKHGKKNPKAVKHLGYGYGTKDDNIITEADMRRAIAEEDEREEALMEEYTRYYANQPELL